MFWRQYSSLFSEFNGSARLYEAPFWIKHSLGEVQEGLPPPLQQRDCLTSSKRDCLLSFFCKKKIAVFLWTRLFSCKTASASALECLLSFFCKKRDCLLSFFCIKRDCLYPWTILFSFTIASASAVEVVLHPLKEIVFSLSFVKKRLSSLFLLYCIKRDCLFSTKFIVFFYDCSILYNDCFTSIKRDCLRSLSLFCRKDKAFSMKEIVF